MIWSFRRGSAEIDIEVRRSAQEKYYLIVSYPDGTEKVERFGSPTRLIERSLKVQRRLIAEHWEPQGAVTRHTHMTRTAAMLRRSRWRVGRRVRLVRQFLPLGAKIRRVLASTFGF
ncbi:MAG: hypothetical protein LC804_08750 [Acidobacteria bacterium]|nr:hypothetical protein [Acidobacteriota bacterium]